MHLYWTILEKKNKQVVEDVEFPGLLKKSQVDFPEG